MEDRKEIQYLDGDFLGGKEFIFLGRKERKEIQWLRRNSRIP